MVAAFSELIENSGVDEVVVGMAHRQRFLVENEQICK